MSISKKSLFQVAYDKIAIAAVESIVFIVFQNMSNRKSNIVHINL